MSVSADTYAQISQAVLYLSRFASMASIGQLEATSVDDIARASDTLSRRRSSMESIRNSIKSVFKSSGDGNHDRQGNGAVEPVLSSLNTEFFQNLLLGTSEKLSLHIRTIVKSLEAPNSFPAGYQREYIQNSIQELIPLIHSFAWIVPRAAAELAAFKELRRHGQSQLIESAQHIICAAYDILVFVNDSLNHGVLSPETEPKLKQLTSYSIHTFISFLDKIQCIDKLLYKSPSKQSTHSKLLDLSLDPQDEIIGQEHNPKQRRRSSKNSISEILYPNILTTAPSSPRLVNARWNVNRDPDRVVVKLEESLSYEPSAPVLPVDIARGLITRKISLPPPYDMLVEKMGILQGAGGSEGRYAVVADEGTEEGLMGEDGRERGVEMEIKRTMARVSFLKRSVLKTEWSAYKKGIVELYGDLMSIHRISNKISRGKQPAVFGHLRHARIASINEEDKIVELEMCDYRVRIQFVGDRWTEWRREIETKSNK